MSRETLDVDILIVGGGPAGLSAALRLSQLQKQHGGEPLSIAVLEKARDAGAHILSGAVLDPSTLRDLIPDFQAKGAPLASPVERDTIYFLTERSKIRFPVVPPPLRNHGNFIISLNAFVRWLSQQVEGEGIDFFTGFAGQDVLMDGARVVGVRTGDRGIGKHGEHKPTFEPGVDIQAKVTIFCDGVRGNLTKTLIERLDLGKDREPEQFAVGLKELWDIPRDRIAAGTVIHTMGYPLRHDEFGGAFIYALPEGRLALGFVTGLDYADPLFDPHMAFNRLKKHPFVAALLDGGTLVRYGAKALPEGGWNTIPRTYMDGGLIAGDAGGFMNSMRLKGIHLAMRSGMLAAETAFEAIRAGDVSAASLKSISGPDRRQRDQDRALSGTERPSVVWLRSLRRAGVLRPCPGDARPVARRPARARRPSANENPGLVLRARRARLACEQYHAGRSQDDLRQADQRTLLGHGTRRRPAVPPHCPDRRVQFALRRRVRTSVHAVLSGQRLRDHPRSGPAAEAADQRVQLRPLQDLRHHGSVSGHHLGAARGRRRTSIQRDVASQ